MLKYILLTHDSVYSKKIQVGSTQVNLMIWDTAGQERFASLSNAFIRGADACLLVFDATKAPNLETLRHWFETFRSNSPVFDNDLNDFCLTAIGNKIDAIDCNSFNSEDYLDTIKFLHPNSNQFKSPRGVISSTPKAIPNRMFNEDNNDQFISSNNTNTRNTIYYTPSSSFDTPSTIEPSPIRLNSQNDNDRNENTDSDDYNINDNDYGFKLFWTSAKTGDGVDQVFE
ncbi:P-loop containing nucleoside triphosphate hydrolase protein [Wallemia mellicola]|nr:P-loop containing nucleoside triphosphate hydrolase protein [Wallemia mellicola]